MRRRRKRVRVESNMLSGLHDEIAQLRATISELQGANPAFSSAPIDCDMEGGIGKGKMWFFKMIK